MKKKLLALLVVISLIACCAVPVFGRTYTLKDNKGDNEGGKFEWGAELFSPSSGVYSADMAKTCVFMERNLVKCDEVSQKEVFASCGLGNITTYSLSSMLPRMSIANQVLPINGVSTELILVALRGNAAPLDYVTNFNVTVSDYYGYQVHSGFKNHAQEARKCLDAFMAANPTTAQSRKFLVTGFSSGGAAANLLAIGIEKDALATRENIFMYAFAAPNYLKGEVPAGFDNFFNFICAEDIVPRMPPSLFQSKWSKLGKKLVFSADTFSTHERKNYLKGIDKAEFTEELPAFTMQSLADWFVGLIKMMLPFNSGQE